MKQRKGNRSKMTAALAAAILKEFTGRLQAARKAARRG